jgi:NAD(P)-dependent dehydrogenase (short-subunit alcohol dehydrogenase family)
VFSIFLDWESISMTRSLNGRVAVITGAGSGMGRSMAIRLAEDNAKIAIWDINGEGAEETARMVRDAGGTAVAIQADCSDPAAIKAAAAKTRAELGKIAILINNAPRSSRSTWRCSRRCCASTPSGLSSSRRNASPT